MRCRCGGDDTRYLDTYKLADNDALRIRIGRLSFGNVFNSRASHDCLTDMMLDLESVVRTEKL